MFIYLFLTLIVLGIPLITYLKKSFRLEVSYFFVFLVFSIIFTFRGPFTQDYNSYKFFYYFIADLPISSIFNTIYPIEDGFIFFTKIINLVFPNYFFYQFIISLVIILPIFSLSKRFSIYPWFSLLLFLVIGGYYSSFNITRQVMAASIFFFSLIFIYKKNIFLYLSLCFLAFLFHKTSLILFLVYPFFFLRINIFTTSAITLFIILFFVFDNEIVYFFGKIFYNGYTYGLGPGSFNGALVPLSISLFIFLFAFFNKVKNNQFLFNGVILYFASTLFGLSTQMIGRFSEFFVIFPILFLPNLIFSFKNKYFRLSLLTIIPILLILFNYISLSNDSYNPYYFSI